LMIVRNSEHFSDSRIGSRYYSGVSSSLVGG
jgi:hypothetical protein